LSDNVLKLIPNDPLFMPSQEAQDKAEAFMFAVLPEADDFSVDISDSIIFVDQGENFENVSCPICKSVLDTDWWSTVINEASEAGFADLNKTVPCCGASVSLNDLCYNSPAGFARFVIQARNPSITDLDENSIKELEGILGCGIKIIWAHY